MTDGFLISGNTKKNAAILSKNSYVCELFKVKKNIYQSLKSSSPKCNGEC